MDEVRRAESERKPLPNRRTAGEGAGSIHDATRPAQTQIHMNQRGAFNIGFLTELEQDKFWESLPRMKSLEYLGLGEPKNTGWNARRIGSLTALKNLGALALSGYGNKNEESEIPKALSTLPKLRHLRLPRYGSLMENETEMPQGLTQLITLYLPRFDTDFARWAGSLSALQELGLHVKGANYRWHEGYFNVLAKLPKLTRLDMHLIGVPEEAYAGLGALPVKDLRVSGGYQSDELVPLIVACPHLEVLICNHRVTATPKLWAAIAKCNRLRVLSIGHSDAKELGAAFEVLTRLEVYCDPAAKDWALADVEEILKAPKLQVVVRFGLKAELMKAITDARPAMRIHRGQSWE